MDMLGVNSNQNLMKSRRQSKSRENNKKEIKVTYISSPMKVKTSASNFRAIVQELTGQDSNVAETFVEEGGNENGAENAERDSSYQQWRMSNVVDESYIAEDSWLMNKPDYSELHKRSFMEPVKGVQPQYHDLLSIDICRFES